MTMYFVHKTKANNTILLICYLLLILIATLCCLGTTNCTSTSPSTAASAAAKATLIAEPRSPPQVPASSMALASQEQQLRRHDASSGQSPAGNQLADLPANQKSTDTQQADADAHADANANANAQPQPQPQLESRTRLGTEPAEAPIAGQQDQRQSELERAPSIADDTRPSAMDSNESAERDVNSYSGNGGRVEQQAAGSAPEPESASSSWSASKASPIDLNELKHDNVHKLMSENDLRRTFYVDSHDQVPEYQILKLTVQSDGSHLISPISDLGELTASAATAAEAATTTTNLAPPSSLAASAAAGQDYETTTHKHRTLPSNAQDTTSTFSTTTTTTNESGPHLKQSSLPNRSSPATGTARNSYTNYSSELADDHADSSDHDGDHERLDETDKTSERLAGVHHDYEQQQSDQVARSSRNKRSAAAAAAATTTTTTNSDTRSSSGKNAQNAQFRDAKHQQQPQAINSNDKLIVMNLSTFGRDFNLRLKRNADFQQRIKDMKMFLAESTGDGQLRYTEIKSPHSQQHHRHHKQEPHKRAAAADDGSPLASELVDEEQQAAASSDGKTSGQHRPNAQQQYQPLASSAKTTTATATITASEDGGGTGGTADQKPVKAKVKAAAGKSGQQQQQQQHHDDQWSIGSTYHDEENLAALLIDHDTLTGQLQMDGTIGNDFVIKPMPRATMEALMAARRRQSSATQGDKRPATHSSGPAAGNAHSLDHSASLDLERSPSSSSSALSSGATVQLAAASKPNESAASKTDQQQSNLVDHSASKLDAASHMHDDDPHDDDEMFLDEDEAIEMAHQSQQASSNQTSGAGSRSAAAATSAPRTLSKAASERKWKKYRKLLAQTQVPKPQQVAAAAAAEAAADSTAQRAKRQLASGTSQDPHQSRNWNQQQQQQQQQIMSHHIVFKQRPSSEASSSEHKHSFMFAPGQQTMEEMVRRFPQARRQDAHALNKRSTADNTLALDPSGSDPADRMHESARSRLSPGHFGAAGSLTDDEHDPLGGQFYLEPGLMTGIDRAGHVDWTLNRRSSLAALPPYALSSASNSTNSTTNDSNYYYQDENESEQDDQMAPNDSIAATNATGGQAKRRYKRHAPAAPLRQAAHRNRANRRHKRQAPDVVWPEVLLVVDYDSFLLHGGDSREVKRYFVSFWNGVDLRYKLLVNPHIRISLAGMIVAKDRDATPYLERNRLRAPNADAVDAAGALTDMGKYLYREDRLPTYDLAVVITKLDMCRRRYEGGRCNRGTAGFAYVGGACVVNKRLEKVNSVAIIEDSGGFSGIIVAAHEVGHLLGCVHDGSPPPSYLGGPGATHCPWEDGFIMSDLRHTERGFRWSQCSVEQFKHFLNGETATCLYNFPHESQMLHRLLPGSMLSLDDQCKRDRGTNACFKDARVCAQLFCFDSASGYCVSYRPAAEGSPCGDGHVCRNGKCVGEIENIIPDYTHQSQTVVARQRPLSSVGGSPTTAAHPSARLADNGLSASSTSTATSSPDNSKAVAPVAAVASAPAGGGGASTVPQISSRMDTFSVDTPLVNTDHHYSNPLYTDYQRSVARAVAPASLTRQQQQQLGANYQLSNLANSNYNQRQSAYTPVHQHHQSATSVGLGNSNIAKSAKLVAQPHGAPGLRYAMYPAPPSDLGISATANSATMAASSTTTTTTGVAGADRRQSSPVRRYQAGSQSETTSAIGLQTSPGARATTAATAAYKYTTKAQANLATPADKQSININSNSNNLFASNSNPLIPASHPPTAPLVNSSNGAAARQRQLSSSSSNQNVAAANSRRQSAYETGDNPRLSHKPASAAGVHQPNEPQLAMNYDFYRQQAFVNQHQHQHHQSPYSSGMVPSY